MGLSFVKFLDKTRADVNWC